MNIIQALEDRSLLGQFLRDPETWASWFAFLKSTFALEPSARDRATWAECTGRTVWPKVPASESWVVAGRRSGKSYIIALIATYLAAFKRYQLSAGETGHVLIIAPTRTQAGIIRDYISGFFSGNDFLRPMVQRETSTEVELNRRVSITILSSDYRNIRGFSAIAAIVDEIAFLQSDGVTPDLEVLRALRPTLAVSGGPLFCVSTPYARRGALFQAWRQHYAKNGDSVHVWVAPSIRMNPTLSLETITRAMQDDPEGAAAEWEATFRSDVESFVSREAAESCVISGRFELPPVAGIRYASFTDPSGGSSDSFTLGIGHASDGKVILDLVRERKPPFSPEEVVKDFAADLKRYRCSEVTSDSYAAEWPREQFRKVGIECRASKKSKSEIYLEILPALNSGKVELLDHEKLLAQLCRLERKTARSGKDSVDHAPGGKDDLVNAACGVLALLGQPVSLPGFFFCDVADGRRPSERWANGDDLD